MLAYHNDPSIKVAIIAQLRAHAKADELVQGLAWENGKGCAVGCTLHVYDHILYEKRFGIPAMLAHIEDAIFEGLPNADAQKWPVRFMSAIRPGQDLGKVGWKFQYWLLTDKTVNPGINHKLVRDAVKQCANLMWKLAAGEPLDVEAAQSAAWSARSAAWSARSAAWSAAQAAARSAAWSARSAQAAAQSAAWSAARSAQAAAQSAAWSAQSAQSAQAAAWSAYKLMADKLIELIKKEPAA